MSAKPELAGQTVVVIGGSSGIGLETARPARAEEADVILERLLSVGESMRRNQLGRAMHEGHTY